MFREVKQALGGKVLGKDDDYSKEPTLPALLDCQPLGPVIGLLNGDSP